MRYPQQIEYSAEFPSKEPAFKFHGNVLLNFKARSQRLPTDTLDEAADWFMASEVRAKLRQSRHFTVDHLVEVDDAMYAVLEGDILAIMVSKSHRPKSKSTLTKWATLIAVAGYYDANAWKQERKLLDESNRS